MMHAYDKSYLNDAQTLLSNAFDYALVDCKLDQSFFENAISLSRLVNEFAHGNPSIIAGMGAIDFIKGIISPILPDFIFPEATFSEDRSPAYWAGWALAYYQWYSAKSFKDIFERIPLLDILSMYKIYHEMDIMRFVDDMEARYNSIVLDSKLKTIREARGLSQNKLAIISGVNKRSIQLYEQRVNDIDKAQAQTLFKLSRALGCNIEDLLESPEKDQ